MQEISGYKKKYLSEYFQIFDDMYILFSLQYTLPLDLISREVFSQWMDVVRQIADRPVPQEINNADLDDDERAELPWWKCKKWALHILHRMFER